MFVLKLGLTVYPWVVWNSQSVPICPSTAYRELGLKAFSPHPAYSYFLVNRKLLKLTISIITLIRVSKPMTKGVGAQLRYINFIPIKFGKLQRVKHSGVRCPVLSTK